MEPVVQLSQVPQGPQPHKKAAELASWPGGQLPRQKPFLSWRLRLFHHGAHLANQVANKLVRRPEGNDHTDIKAPADKPRSTPSPPAALLADLKGRGLLEDTLAPVRIGGCADCKQQDTPVESKGTGFRGALSRSRRMTFLLSC
jgi:hypothetical protein